MKRNEHNAIGKTVFQSRSPSIVTEPLPRTVGFQARLRQCLRKSYRNKLSLAFDVLGAAYTSIGVEYLSNADLTIRLWLNLSAMGLLTLGSIASLLQLRANPRDFLPLAERRCASWFISPFAFLFYHVLLVGMMGLAYGLKVTDFVDHGLTNEVEHNITLIEPPLLHKACTCVDESWVSFADTWLVRLFFIASFSLKWLGALVLVCDAPLKPPASPLAKKPMEVGAGVIAGGIESKPARRHSSGSEGRGTGVGFFPSRGEEEIDKPDTLASAKKDNESAKEDVTTDEESFVEGGGEASEMNASLIKELREKIMVDLVEYAQKGTISRRAISELQAAWEKAEEENQDFLSQVNFPPR